MAFIGNTNTTQGFIPAIDYFSGNGSSVAFTLSRPVASVYQFIVSIDNVIQNPSSAYSVSGTTLTFTSAPLAGTNNIWVEYTSPITQTIAPGQGTVTTSSLASSTGSGAVVLQTSPTITTPTISSLTSAAATNLTLQSAGTTALTIDTSQNVGIGTTSPKNNSGYTTLTLNNASSGGVVEFTSNNTTVAQLYNTGTDFYTYSASGKNIVFDASGLASIKMNTNGTERMRIDSSGSVLVGTTTSGNGKFVVVQTSGSRISRLESVDAGTVEAVQFVKNSGGLGQIGSITTTTTATAYNTSSDYRLKENILPMIGALDKVLQLKPCTYTWKSDSSNGQGFIAHELQAIIPDAVTGEKDAVDEEGNIKPQGVDTSFLVATLTAAIQEMKAIIDAQSARITALENK